MKYQAIVVPNRLISHLSGPFCGPQNNCKVLNKSNLLSHLESHAIQPGSLQNDPLECCFSQVYGDSAYGVSPVTIGPYLNTQPWLLEEGAWNMVMGGVRISVKHGFGMVLKDWPNLNCFWQQQVWCIMCGTMYHVGVLLSNAHACLVQNQISHHYNCLPPTLDEYFHVN